MWLMSLYCKELLLVSIKMSSYGEWHLEKPWPSSQESKELDLVMHTPWIQYWKPSGFLFVYVLSYGDGGV